MARTIILGSKQVHGGNPDPEFLKAVEARRNAIRKLERGHGLTDAEMRLIYPEHVQPVDATAPQQFERCDKRKGLQCSLEAHHAPPHFNGIERW